MNRKFDCQLATLIYTYNLHLRVFYWLALKWQLFLFVVSKTSQTSESIGYYE